MTEQALWRAVITQALLDRHKPTAVTPNEAQKVRDEATRWLMGCPDLEQVCDFAEMDYNYIIDLARKMPDDQVQEMRRNCHLKKGAKKFNKKKKRGVKGGGVSGERV